MESQEASGNTTAPEFWERRRLIRESALSTTEKLALVWIADYAGDGGECFASVATLAAAVSIRERWMRQTLRTLEDRGLIECRARSGHASVIRILWDGGRQWSAGVGQGQPRHSSAGGGGSGVPPNTKRTQTQHPTLTPKARKPPFDPTTAVLPESIDTPEVRAAWVEWCDYRRAKRKPVSLPAASKQLKTLAAHGAAAAVSAIERSIANDWVGLFPERAGRNGHAKPLHSGLMELAAEREGELDR